MSTKQDLYKNLTLEKLEAAISDLYFEKDTGLTIEALKAKILSGYAYAINDGKLHTGQGGAWMFIDACVERGMPAWMIQEAITVYIPEKGGSFKLEDINVTKINAQH